MAETNYMAQFGARLVANGYSILPIAPGTKKPGRFRSGEWGELPGWPQYSERRPTELEVATWAKWPEAGIGVVGGAVAAVDIDICDDPDLAIRIEGLCREHLGDSPALRIGRACYGCAGWRWTMRALSGQGPNGWHGSRSPGSSGCPGLPPIGDGSTGWR